MRPDALKDFDERNEAMLVRQASDEELQRLSREWLQRSAEHEYSYHFTWLGRPIIQYPQDILALQEIIWSCRPDVIVETGIAHGGSLIFFASMLELLGGSHRRAIGVDVDIRAHNRELIEQHPLAGRVTLVEGSSTDSTVLDAVRACCEGAESVMVILDSDHTHDHVSDELDLYSPLVTTGSYLVVFDTAIELMPDALHANRPWGRGNNAQTAVEAFLAKSDTFEVDRILESKLLITVAPGGYLRRVR